MECLSLAGRVQRTLSRRRCQTKHGKKSAKKKRKTRDYLPEQTDVQLSCLLRIRSDSRKAKFKVRRC